MTYTPAACLVIVAIALTGCGSGDDTPTDAAVKTERTTPTPPAPTPAEDRRKARAATITIKDMPKGWARNKADPPNQAPKKTPCKKLERAKTTLVARASSGGFKRGERTIRNFVYIYPTADDARTAFDSLTHKSSRRCVAAITRRGLVPLLTDGIKIAGITHSQIKTPDLGDETQGSRFRVLLAQNGNTGSVDYDTTHTLSGRAVTVVDLYNVGTPHRRSVVEAAAQRLERAMND